MKKILDENVTKPFLHEIVVDEIVNCFGRKCFWTKVFLDESVFGRVFFFFANWMKMYLTGSPQCDSVLVEGRHHGGVNGELSTSVEPQPRPPALRGVSCRHADERVSAHTRACLTTYSRRC